MALRYELTGGFIKNAILSALSIAVSRDGDSPVVCQQDLLQGANLQLRGRLRMKNFDRRVVPSAGLDEMIVEEAIMKQLQLIVQFEKAKCCYKSYSVYHCTEDFFIEPKLVLLWIIQHAILNTYIII